MFDSGHKGSCSISEGLLLAPSCVNNISKRDNDIIKEALFEFLNKSDRTIIIPALHLFTQGLISYVFQHRIVFTELLHTTEWFIMEIIH